MKNSRKGQAKLWNSRVIKNMRRGLKSPQQRLIFEISLFTGERIGAIVQLRVSDVYDSSGKVLEALTFAATTRKATKHGMAATRQVAVHPELKLHLQNFVPLKNGYLFPSESKTGHISRRAVDKYWRSVLNDYGYVGYSTHSSRRWVINQLRSKGIEIVTIAEVMGMNVNTVRHYLDNDENACKNAIATLSI